MKPDALKDLIGIIQKRLPQPEGGVLTKEEADEWRAERTRAKAAEEDRAVLQEAPAVKKQLTDLGVTMHDEAEFSAGLSLFLVGITIALFVKYLT